MAEERTILRRLNFPQGSPAALGPFAQTAGTHHLHEKVGCRAAGWAGDQTMCNQLVCRWVGSPPPPPSPWQARQQSALCMRRAATAQPRSPVRAQARLSSVQEGTTFSARLLRSSSCAGAGNNPGVGTDKGRNRSQLCISFNSRPAQGAGHRWRELKGLGGCRACCAGSLLPSCHEGDSRCWAMVIERPGPAQLRSPVRLRCFSPKRQSLFAPSAAAPHSPNSIPC